MKSTIPCGWALFFFFCFYWLLPVHGQMIGNGEILTFNEVKSQFDALNQQKSLSPTEKLSLQDLSRTLEFLDEIEQLKQELALLKQQLQQAPIKTRQALIKIEAIKNAGNENNTVEKLNGLSLRQLENKLGGTLNELQTLQETLESNSSQLILLKTLPERAQSLMLSNSQQIQRVRNELVESGTAHTTLQNMLSTQLVLLNLSLEYQRQSLSASTVLQDSLQKENDYITAKINQLEHLIQQMHQAENDKRLSLSKETAKEAQHPDNVAQDIEDPLVAAELALNRQLSQRFIETTEKINQLIQENIQVKNWLDRSLQAERNLKEQITVLKGSLLLSRILYQQQKKLPTEELTHDVAEQIADLRLEQFDVNEKRDALLQRDAYVAQLISHSKEKPSAGVIATLMDIIDARRDLLDQLNKQLGTQLTYAINLQINQQQLLSVNSYLQRTLTQHIFWVSSNKAMNWSWWKELPASLQEQVASLKLGIKPNALLMGALNSLFVLIPALLFVGLLHWRNKKIHSHLKMLANDVGQLNRDTQLHTPMALFLSVFKALPGVVVLLAMGFWLSRSSLAISEFIWALSKQLALFWLVFGSIYQLLLPGGVSERHFNLSSARCVQYRQLNYRLGLALLPLISWGVLGQTDPLYLNEDVVGQLVMLFTFALLAVLIFPIFRNAWQEKSSSSIRLVLVTLMALIPLCLMGLTAGGYFYTALRLGSRWLDSLYLILLWGVVYAAAIRGLSVAAQRLTYRRASVLQQQAVARERGDCVESGDEGPLAIERINDQSLRLTRMVLLLIFGSCFYWIWADLVTVITYLDSVALWHSNSGTGSSETLQTVTLGSIIFATLTLVIAYILMRNLPGLLEVLVLSRFSLRQGSSYAITTILSYLIIVVGIMVFFASLGVSWDKLQWLAAALSVGLGFGLQEIFGNFISGLIILFERPVRIGDTITIGSFSGTVNKIRIRATTITDFDRKEVIIPNKAFVTERLINWSLSDTTTRIIIKLGVAYGSDLKKVREILLKAAKENPRVMADPEPQVFFLAFGASTLDHELRLFVSELIDRSYVVDELNRRLDQLCRENGIVIAFNQLEVYLHPSSAGEGTDTTAKGEPSLPSPS